MHCKICGLILQFYWTKQSLSKHWNKITKNFKHRYICRCMSQIQILFNGISLGNSFSHSHAFSTNRQNSTMGLQCIPVPFSTNFCTVGANIWLHKTTKWPKEERKNNHLQNTTQKTKGRVTRNPLKTEDELMCSRRVSSSCSTSELTP
jgi:hypothetical protein